MHINAQTKVDRMTMWLKKQRGQDQHAAITTTITTSITTSSPWLDLDACSSGRRLPLVTAFTLTLTSREPLEQRVSAILTTRSRWQTSMLQKRRPCWRPWKNRLVHWEAVLLSGMSSGSNLWTTSSPYSLWKPCRSGQVPALLQELIAQ